MIQMQSLYLNSLDAAFVRSIGQLFDVYLQSFPDQHGVGISKFKNNVANVFDAYNEARKIADLLNGPTYDK